MGCTNSTDLHAFYNGEGALRAIADGDADNVVKFINLRNNYFLKRNRRITPWYRLTDRFGNTALILAEASENYMVVEALLRSFDSSVEDFLGLFSCLTHQNVEGLTFLHYAVLKRDMVALDLVLNYFESKMDAKVMKGAKKDKRLRRVHSEDLLEPRTSTYTERGETPLMTAITMCDPGYLRQLLDKYEFSLFEFGMDNLQKFSIVQPKTKRKRRFSAGTARSFCSKQSNKSTFSNMDDSLTRYDIKYKHAMDVADGIGDKGVLKVLEEYMAALKTTRADLDEQKRRLEITEGRRRYEEDHDFGRLARKVQKVVFSENVALEDEYGLLDPAKMQMAVRQNKNESGLEWAKETKKDGDIRRRRATINPGVFEGAQVEDTKVEDTQGMPSSESDSSPLWSDSRSSSKKSLVSELSLSKASHSEESERSLALMA